MLKKFLEKVLEELRNSGLSDKLIDLALQYILARLFPVPQPPMFAAGCDNADMTKAREAANKIYNDCCDECGCPEQKI